MSGQRTEFKTPTFNSREEKASARVFIHKIKKLISNKTDPVIVQAILRDTRLDNLLQKIEQEDKDHEVVTFFQKLTKEPVDMDAFIEHLECAVLDNGPLCSLLAFIQDNNLISDDELKSAISMFQFQVNALCIFEAITIAMLNSNDVAEYVFEHVLSRRANIFCNRPGSCGTFFMGIPLQAGLFDRLKIISVDPAMAAAARYKLLGNQDDTPEHAKNFIKRHKLSGSNSKACKQPYSVGCEFSSIETMSVNILEALTEDAGKKNSKKMGCHQNAEAGSALITLLEQLGNLYCPTKLELKDAVLPKSTFLKEDGSYNLLPGLKIKKQKRRIAQFQTPDEWNALYNSWNLHFVSHTFNQVFLPLKLLLPSVLTPGEFSFSEARILSLFLFANLYVGEQLQKKAKFSQRFEFANAEKIFLAWGEINKEYGKFILKIHCPTQADISLETVLNQLVGKRFHRLNLFCTIGKFFKDRKNFRCTPEPDIETLSKDELFDVLGSRDLKMRRGPVAKL